MAEPTPNPPNQSPGKAQRTLSGTLKDCFFERYPESKPFREYLGERFAGMKLRKWVVLLISAIVLACIAAYSMNLHDKSAKSYLQGKLDATDKTVDRLGQELKQTKDDARQQISDMRADFNGRISERDARINQLVTQNEGLQSRLQSLDLLTRNNTVAIQPNLPQVQVRPMVLSQLDASRITGELSKLKPLETKILLASSEQKAKDLAEQIRDMFLGAGFTTAQIVHDIDESQLFLPKEWVTTNGIQVTTKEIPPSDLASALSALSRATGSREGWLAGQQIPAQLLVIVRNQ